MSHQYHLSNMQTRGGRALLAFEPFSRWRPLSTAPPCRLAPPTAAAAALLPTPTSSSLRASKQGHEHTYCRRSPTKVLHITGKQQQELHHQAPQSVDRGQ